MAFKPIDLQTSLPRTVELSPVAHQQQQRPVTDQAMLAQQTIKHAEHQAHRLTQTESAAKGQIADGRSKGGGRHAAKGNKRTGGNGPEQDNRSEHPFKGRHIDFMG